MVLDSIESQHVDFFAVWTADITWGLAGPLHFLAPVSVTPFMYKVNW